MDHFLGNEPGKGILVKTHRVFKTGLLNVFLQCVFLTLMFIAGSRLLVRGGSGVKFILLTGIVLIPCFIWAFFFYLQDRREPEPTIYVIWAFFSGMAVASLGFVPFSHIVFRAPEWIYSSFVLFVLGSFFIFASIVSFLLYLVLRYGFFPLKEFDEPVDGMVYGAVSGAGMAFVASLYYLMSRPDSTLFVIAYLSTTNILVYSGAGTLIGYVLGQAKFQKRNREIESLKAVLAATALLGICRIVNEFIFISGLQGAFWLSFVLTSVYCISILVYGTVKMNKLSKQPVPKGVSGYSKFDYSIGILMVIVLIPAYLIAHTGLKGKKFENSEYGISFYYPYKVSSFGWQEASLPTLSSPYGRSLFLGNFTGESPFMFSLHAHQRDGKKEPETFMQYVETTQTQSLSVEDILVGGKKAKRLAYSFLVKEKGAGHEFPKLMQVYKDIVFHGDFFLIFTCRASAEYFLKGSEQYEKILMSVKWMEHER